MNCNAADLLLYAVTDSRWLEGKKLCDQVEKAILGGASFVQLREKELDEEAFLQEAKEVQAVCKKYGVPFVINDNVEIALLIDADGVHVGQSDMEAGDVRAKLGPDKIIGVTCKTVEQAKIALAHGADYLGVGAMFPTGTKANTIQMKPETLREICESVEIPVVAIGGLTLENLDVLKDTKVAGAAVVSAIFAQTDIREASRKLKEKIAELCC